MLKVLHWRSIRQRIEYEVASLVWWLGKLGLAPTYLTDLCPPVLGTESSRFCFGMGVIGYQWNIIVQSYNVQEYEMRTKWWLFRNRIICVQLNKNSGDDTLNHVLHASICSTVMTHDLQFLNPDSRPPDFKPDWRHWLSVPFARTTIMLSCALFLHCTSYLGYFHTHSIITWKLFLLTVFESEASLYLNIFIWRL